jgi:type VI secretion system protein ImpH
MSTPQRLHGAGLIDQLFENPHRFQFFQAVRLLEAWLSDEEKTGADLLPQRLHFRNSVALSFPPSEIESLKRVQREPAGGESLPERIDMTPAFMGLLGIAGALPSVYTEQIAQRELYNKDFAARSFLDLFSNRAVALFYAAWKKSRLHLLYESDRKNRFAPMVLALAGVGQQALNDRLQADRGGVNDESLAFFGGAIQQRVLSARQLQQLLSKYLNVPVRIEQFCGRWYTLPKEALTSLGKGNGVLGRNALSGERVWQRDLRVKVMLGPLGQGRFQRFLPGAPGSTALRELITLLSGVGLEYEVNLTLEAKAVQGSALDSRRSPLSGRLGWDTYMQTRPSTEDRCDVRYDVHAMATA